MAKQIYEFPQGDGTSLFKIGEDVTHAKTQMGYKQKVDAEAALSEIQEPKVEPIQTAPEVTGAKPSQITQPVTGEQT